MSSEKPLPLLQEGGYLFTLSSYDPVEIEIVVPQVTDYDVLAAVAAYLESSGTSLDDFDETWLRAHHAELHVGEDATMGEYLETMRRALGSTQQSFAEQEKPARCAQALSERLCQRIPPDMLASVRTGVLGALEAEQRADPEAFAGLLALQHAGTAEELAEAEAEEIAEQCAALDAYADHCRISVADSELARLLRLPEKEAESEIGAARAQGRLEDLLAEARRNKAALQLAESCRCLWQKESDESAEARRRAYRGLEEAEGIDLEKIRQRLFAKTPEGGGHGESPRFRLV